MEGGREAVVSPAMKEASQILQHRLVFPVKNHPQELV